MNLFIACSFPKWSSIVRGLEILNVENGDGEVETLKQRIVTFYVSHFAGNYLHKIFHEIEL